MARDVTAVGRAGRGRRPQIQHSVVFRGAWGGQALRIREAIADSALVVHRGGAWSKLEDSSRGEPSVDRGIEVTKKKKWLLRRNHSKWDLRCTQKTIYLPILLTKFDPIYCGPP